MTYNLTGTFLMKVVNIADSKLGRWNEYSFAIEYMPRREDFFVPNGNTVEFGKQDVELGDFDDDAYEMAKDTFYHRRDIWIIDEEPGLEVGDLVNVEFRNGIPKRILSYKKSQGSWVKFTS